MSVKPEHVKIYDIFDRMANILQDLNNISNYVEDGWKLPNSLQSMLGKVYRYEGKTVSEIADIYDIDLKNTTRYVNELQKRGLIYKEQHGKKKTLILTEEGHRLHRVLSEEKGLLLDQIMNTLSEDAILKTVENLEKIARRTHDFYNDLRKAEEIEHGKCGNDE